MPHRGQSWTPVASKMELLMTKVNGIRPLTIVTNIDAAEVLDQPLP